MKKLQTMFLCGLLAACGAPGPKPGTKGNSDTLGAETTRLEEAKLKYQYLGTYERFATPMGSAVSVIMSDGKKIKIASIDDTKYVNIRTHKGIPDIRINGTYGINGRYKTSSFGAGTVFIVEAIEHLYGGQQSDSSSKQTVLPDFFEIDASAHGPLTRTELNIRFPDTLDRYFNSSDLECFYQQVDLRAAEMGDPATLPPIRRVLLTNSEMLWNEMSGSDKRLQLARYVTSMALSDC